MYVHRPDARLFTLSFGQGPVTLLALGGWIGSGEVWHDLFGQLTGWRCISYDHRGSGASSHGDAPITIDAMVDDLFAVFDAHRITGPCILAAESAGGGIALEAALRMPGHFAGLALIDPSWDTPAPDAFTRLIGGLKADYAATIAAFVENCLPEAGSEDLRRWGRQILHRATARHAIELLTCRSAATVQDHLHEIATPALIVHGTLDRITPAEKSEILAARLPNAELHLLEGLGHVPIVSAPDRVAALIERKFGVAAPASRPAA